MKIFENKSKLAVLAAAPLVAVALTLAIGTLTQQTVAAPNLSHGFAVGGFTAMDLSHVAFAAQIIVKNNFTVNYSGHVVQEDATGASRHGPVYCVYVSGNQAVVVWTVSKSDFDPNEVGTMRSFEVIDGGEPPAGMDMYKDRQTAENRGPDTNGIFQPILRGNIVVKNE